MHESQLQPEEKPHKRDLFCTDEIRYDGENSKTLHSVLILDDGVYDGAVRLNQLQKWILFESSVGEWVLLQQQQGHPGYGVLDELTLTIYSTL